MPAPRGKEAAPTRGNGEGRIPRVQVKAGRSRCRISRRRVIGDAVEGERCAALGDNDTAGAIAVVEKQARAHSEAMHRKWIDVCGNSCRREAQPGRDGKAAGIDVADRVLEKAAVAAQVKIRVQVRGREQMDAEQREAATHRDTRKRLGISIGCGSGPRAYCS